MTKINREMASRFLSYVPEQNRFWCVDGNVFNNLAELESGLKLMSAKIFKSHVNAEKNDFSNWIYDVIGDIELAESIRKCKDKKTLLQRVASRVDHLKSLAS